jgi:hypothetical protein
MGKFNSPSSFGREQVGKKEKVSRLTVFHPILHFPGFPRVQDLQDIVLA